MPRDVEWCIANGHPNTIPISVKITADLEKV